jgi:hypothetical protein
MPNAGGAVVDIRKLRDYCLSPDHPRARHKAYVFRGVLGLTDADAVTLHQALLDAARTRDAVIGEKDQYGQRYVVDFVMDGPAGQGGAWCAAPGSSCRARTTRD